MSDEDFEPFVGGPPPDPSERTWRHPSEIAAQAQADALADLTTTRSGRRAITAWRPSASPNVLIAGSLGAAACLTVLALFQFTTGTTSPEPGDVAGPTGTVEALDPGQVLDADGVLDSAAAASGLATPQPPSTVAVSLTTIPDVSPMVASVADNRLVGITIGADFVATGVLVDGYLITSANAVGNQLSISYSNQDRWALAYLVGIDPFSDLAVFRPSTESRAGRTLEALSTNVGGDAGQWTDETSDLAVAQLGDELTSIALTDGGLETSNGTVLAVEHSDVTSDGQPLIGLIDTSIRRPDHLGSVLINAAGDIVGIVVDASSSLASAVPIRDAAAIADRLNQQGWANETWIGFVGIDQDDGVEVIDVVPGAPAESAGLRPGDVIRYLDGARINHMGGITAGLRRAAPDDIIVVVVERSGELVAHRIQVMAYISNIAEGDEPLVAPDGTSDADPLSEPIDG